MNTAFLLEKNQLEYQCNFWYFPPITYLERSMSSFWGLDVSNYASLLVFVDLPVRSIVHNNYMYSKGSERCWFDSPSILPGHVLKNKALLWLICTYCGTLTFSHYDKVKPNFQILLFFAAISFSQKVQQSTLNWLYWVSAQAACTHTEIQ